MSLLEKLFIFLLLIAYPLGELTRIKLAPSVSVNFLDLTVLVIVLVFAITVILKKNFLKGKLFIPIAAFIIIAAFSLILNINRYSQQEFFISFLYLGRWILYSSIYFVVLSLSSYFKKTLPYLMLLSAFLIIMFGFIQYFFYPDLRPLHSLGWDDHLYRLFSVYLDPNFAAVILVFIFIFSSALLIKHFESKVLCNKLLFLAILSLLAVFLTYSRSGLIMLFVSTGIFLFLIKKKKVFSLFFFASLIIIFLLPNLSEGTNFLRSASIATRIESMEKGLIIFRENPVIGVGFNGYRYEQYRKGFLKVRDWQENHAGSGVENSYIFILATTGILGFSAYLLLLFAVIYEAFKKRKKSIFSIVVLSSVIGLMVNAFFINSFFYSFILVWLWTLFAVNESI